jgi:hypothetical protein
MYTPEEQQIIDCGEAAQQLIDQIGQGDINSQERGSGARANLNKPHWGLLPLSQLLPFLHDEFIIEGPNSTEPIPINDCVYHIAFFQRTGQGADDLLRHSIAFLMDAMNVDFWDACEEVIRVWEHGEAKYAAFNWMKGMSWNSVVACYMRHIRKISKGTTIDEESGRHHGAHLVCNAMMLVHYVTYFPEGNDLPIRWYKETNHELR